MESKIKTEIQINKERIEYIDLAKGFCIIMVVATHTADFLSFDSYADYDFFRISRMPLYFFMSGLFFKTYSSLSCFARKKINKLIIPFLFFFFITSFLFPLLVTNYIPRFPHYRLSVLYYWIYGPKMAMFNGPLWFLVCLFELNILYYLLHKIINPIDRTGIVLLLVTIIIGFWGFAICQLGFDNFMYLGSTMAAIPFFAFGNFIKNKTSWLYAQKWDKYLLIISFLGVLFISFVGGDINYFKVETKLSIWRCYVGGIVGVLTIIAIAKYLKKLSIISFLGKYSIVILCTHYVLLLFLCYNINLLIVPVIIKFLLSVIICLFLCAAFVPILKSCVPWAIGRKDIL